MVPKMMNTADETHKSIHTSYKMHLAMMQSNEKFIRINVLVMYYMKTMLRKRKRGTQRIK